jgi:hypothetical protein
MPTSSFYRPFILSPEACEIIIEELETSEPYIPKKNIYEELKKGEEALKRILPLL